MRGKSRPWRPAEDDLVKARHGHSVARTAHLLGLSRNRKTRPGDSVGPFTILSLERRPVGAGGRRETFATCRCGCGREATTRLDHLRAGCDPCVCRSARRPAPEVREAIVACYRNETMAAVAARYGVSARTVWCYAKAAGLSKPTGLKAARERVPAGTGFGPWRTVGAVRRRPGGRLVARVRCGGCGREKSAPLYLLESGRSGSCVRCAKPGLSVTAFGETKPVREWVRDRRSGGAKADRVRRRLGAGWPPESAIATPVRPYR